MTSQEIIAGLRALADSMEAHKPDADLRHRLTVELVAWDLDVSVANPQDGLLRGLSSLLEDLAEQAH